MPDASPTPLAGGGPTSDSAAVQSVNVVDWSRRLGHDQGQVRRGVGAVLTVGGQRPVDAHGRLLHEGDTVAQVALALDNLTDVVVGAGMALADLSHLRIHTTNRAALGDALVLVRDRLAAHGATTPITIVEVKGLALPAMEVEIDALALSSTHPDEGTRT